MWLQVLSIQHLTLLSTMLLLSWLWLTDVLWSDGQCYIAAMHHTSMFKTVSWVWNGNKAVGTNWAWDSVSLWTSPGSDDWVGEKYDRLLQGWVGENYDRLSQGWVVKIYDREASKIQKIFAYAGPGPPAYEFPHLLPPNSTTEYIDTITEVTNSSLKMFICSLARAAIGWSLSASKPPYSVATP